MDAKKAGTHKKLVFFVGSCLFPYFHTTKSLVDSPYSTNPDT